MISHVSFRKTTFAELAQIRGRHPDFVDIAAFSAALDFIESVGLDDIAAHEHELLEWTTAEMLKIPGMRIFGTAPGKSPLISFLIGKAHHYDTGMLLDKLGVAVRTGHHCAQPLMESLGIRRHRPRLLRRLQHPRRVPDLHRRPPPHPPLLS